MTIYFEEEMCQALRTKAAETEQLLSSLVNEAVRFSLGEDADDLAAFAERAGEPDLVFERVLKDLKRCGTI